MECNILKCLIQRSRYATEFDLIKCEKCCYQQKTNSIQDKTYAIMREKFVKDYWRKLNNL